MRVLSIAFGVAFLLSTATSAWAQDSDSSLIPELQAETHGLTRAWFAQLPIAGLRSRIQSIVPDDDLLLITTTSADVYAVDAETGRLVWSRRQVIRGNRRFGPPATASRSSANCIGKPD